MFVSTYVLMYVCTNVCIFTIMIVCMCMFKHFLWMYLCMCSCFPVYTVVILFDATNFKA